MKVQNPMNLVVSRLLMNLFVHGLEVMIILVILPATYHNAGKKVHVVTKGKRKDVYVKILIIMENHFTEGTVNAKKIQMMKRK
tara:strand:+ start:325 stop:573 length:249 start_codon:yes stop_codon:yes gene_type:complete